MKNGYGVLRPCVCLRLIW